jgi:transcriptional regulator with XRE-family HTH domain
MSPSESRDLSPVDALEEVRLRRLTRPERAKAIREAAGVSQAAVARSLGVHRQTIAKWEGGDRHPQRNLLRRYADLLHKLEAAAGK